MVMRETEKISDAELVARIEKEGNNWDTESVSMLYRRYFRSIYCFALQRVKDPGASEDIRQDTVTAVIRAIKEKRIKDPQNLAAYVRGVCRNKVMNFLSQEERIERSDEMEGIADGRADALQSLVAEEEAKTLNNTKRALEECIKRLNQSRKNILILYFHENLSTSEIAGRIGITTGNARKQKHDALQALKKCLKKTVTK